MSNETEWTEPEQEALARLPREGDPGQLVEERTVAALRERGLLGRAPAGHRGRGRGSQPRENERPSPASRSARVAWSAAGLAAALALFLGGMAVGEARSGAAALDLAQALTSAETAERPSLVQHTGSLYVDAVAGLAAARAEGREEVLETGVEVALATLYAAAYELAVLEPADPWLRQALRAFEAGEVGAPPAAVEIHWF